MSGGYGQFYYPAANHSKVLTADIAPGALAATALGRAIMAANYFNTATVTDKIADDAFTLAEFVAGAGGKFAAGCIDNAAWQNIAAAGAIGVDVPSRASIAAGYFDAATATNKFAAGSIAAALLAAAINNLGNIVADPGNGGAIPNGVTGRCDLTVAGAGQTRTLAAPAGVGQLLVINSNVVGAGATCAITVAAAFNDVGNTICTFTDVGAIPAGRENITFVSTLVNGAAAWRLVANNGGALS